MNTAKSLLGKIAVLLPLVAATSVSAPRDASAQYVAPPPPPPPQGQYVTPPPPPSPQYVAPPPPPDAYIATSQPEYYEGHSVYWYNGNWYYRDEHGAWNYYHTEPQYLHDRRPKQDDRHRYQYRR